MVNKVYTYGCSFSSDWWIDESETFTALVAKELKCEYIRRAEPAICNNEIYHRFAKDLKLFKEGDFIIYQFTALDRGGYYVSDDSLYVPTSLLTDDIEMNNVVFNEWGVGRSNYNITDDDVLKLVEYTNVWERHTMFYKYNIVYNTLQFLKQYHKINFVMVFLDNYFSKFCTNNCIKFPLDRYANNYSIRDWVIENKMTVADSNPIRPKWDTHPNQKAHSEIASKILNYINNGYK